MGKHSGMNNNSSKGSRSFKKRAEELVVPGPDQYVGFISKKYGHGRYDVRLLTLDGVGEVTIGTKMASVHGKINIDDLVLCEIPQFRLGSASRKSSSQHIIVHHYYEGEGLLLVNEEIIGRHSRAVAQAMARGDSVSAATMSADVGFDFVAQEEDEVEETDGKTSKREKKNHRAAATMRGMVDFDSI